MNEDMNNIFPLLLVGLLGAGGWAASGCAGAGPSTSEPTEQPPPFNARAVAWSQLLEPYPELARPKVGQKRTDVVDAMLAFYAVVDDERENPPAQFRRKACRKGWQQLVKTGRENETLAAPLLLARSYLGIECSRTKLNIQGLNRFIKRRGEADLLYYSARFWLGETYLAAKRLRAARQQYRWILGEIESPLYPLALLRTGHCHWDEGDRDQARQYLEHVRDWAATAEQSQWVVALRQKIETDLSQFPR
jgi:tetratricopeptide (TPR) repeat protein